MKYRVGKYEIDTQQFTFAESGKVLSIEPKVFDVIIYLLTHRNKVVSRDELFKEVWMGREVSDTTLSNHINSARKLFGDNGERQNVIKTIRGRGYQFVAEVNELSDAIQSKTSSNTHEFSALPSSSKYLSTEKLNRTTNTLFKITQVLLLALILIVGTILLWPEGLTSKAVDQRKVVLVLPMGVSSVNTQKWQPLADQMTREVIRKLSHVSALQVIPASSTFSFKNDRTNSHIRSKLPEVDYVLDAMINVNGESELRITTDMIDLESGNLFWGREFERKVNESNFFSIQNDIANAVADLLEIVLGDNEKRLLSTLPTENLAAYELYVAGQEKLNKLDHTSLLQAIEMFDSAVAIDPNFTRALLAKADAYRIIMSYFARPADILPSVVDAVNAVLSQDASSAEALSSLGLAYVLAWRWEDAWIVLNKAKAINPNLALTDLGFAIYYSGMGDKQKVKKSLENASKIDPLNIELADWGHWALAMVGDLDTAVQWATNQIRLHPEVGMIYSGASVSASLTNKHNYAVELARKGVELDADSPYAHLALAQAYGYAGHPDKIPPLLEKAESFGQYVCPYETAINYIILDQLDQAFSLFNEAVSARSNCLVFTRNDKRLKPIKNDRRYKSLLTRIGLDDKSIEKNTK